MTKKIQVQEVITRDGFQIEPDFISTEEKVNLINNLSNTGLRKIEVSSFVSPKAVPQLSDAKEVFEKIDRSQHVTYLALVTNQKGVEQAIESNVDEVNLVMSASETHNLANVRRTCETSLVEFENLINDLKQNNIRVNGTIATSFGCPYVGITDEKKVTTIVQRYINMGVDSITLADTTGMATPKHVKSLIKSVRKTDSEIDITLHFHNTRGLGLANVLAGIEEDVVRYDASLGGLGGCPFAPGATGNISTEDLVHMLQFMDYDTDVDLDKLLKISASLPNIVKGQLTGQVVKAGKISDLHPIPKRVKELLNSK